MAELFEKDQFEIDPEKDYLAELVGEDKKFKTPAELARGKAESDAFIERIKAENAQLRDQQQQQANLAEVLEQLKADRETQTQTQNRKDSLDDNQNQSEELTLDKIKTLFEQELTSREAKSKADQNFAFVEQEAEKVFGPSFRSELERRRVELGLGHEFLNDLARTQPQAFLKILSVEKRDADSGLFRPPQSERKPDIGPSSKKNYKYYQDMFRKDPQLYQTASIQKEMMEAAKAQGEDFYN